MANTIAQDIFNPDTVGNRNPMTNAGVRLNVENAMEIPLRLNALPWSRNKELDLRTPFRRVLLSDPNTAEAQKENSQWQPVRPLYTGRLGSITLWKKYDANNMEIDTCVIKEQVFRPLVDQYAGLPAGVANEAVYQHQLNILPDGEVTIKLRRYKYYPNEDQGRFYMEYCPHMDLDILRERYRAWDTYLPEAFLWHIFVALTRAAVLLEQGAQPWTRLHPGGSDPAPLDPLNPTFLVHLDIKPSNIFLQDAPEDLDFDTDPTSIYPQIKLADYGLSRMIGPFEDVPNHPNDFEGDGTRYFRPPEQDVRTSEWAEPLKGQRPVPAWMTSYEQSSKEVKRSADGYGIRFGPNFNLWGIGKTMRDLYYLHESDEYDQLTWKAFNSEEQEDRYYRYGDILGPDSDPDNYQEPGPNYSAALLELINDCMRLNADDRPSPAEALQRAYAGQENIIGVIREAGLRARDNEVRLFYRGNEINNLPRGGERFDEDLDEDAMEAMYNDLVDNKYKDIRWGRLKPPYQKFGTEIRNDLAIGRDRGVWPAGEGPFRWDGGKVVLASAYEPGREVTGQSESESGDGGGESDPDTGDGTGVALGGTGGGAVPAVGEGGAIPAISGGGGGPGPGAGARFAPGYRACGHNCFNKATCRHAPCCKTGVKI